MRHVEQLAVVQASHPVVPSDVVPLAHAVHVKFYKPKLNSHYVQLAAAKLHVLHVESQASQRKVVELVY